MSLLKFCISLFEIEMWALLKFYLLISDKKCKCTQLKDFQADGIQRCMEVFGNLGILYDTEVR